MQPPVAVVYAMQKENLNLGKNYPKIFFYPNFGYFAITVEAELVESQSKAQKTWI